MNREILDCSKRERDICVKNVILSQNMDFMFTPALINWYGLASLKDLGGLIFLFKMKIF